MTIYITSDHAAFEQKQEIIERLQGKVELTDLGPESDARTDYPIFGKKIAEAVLSSSAKGVALCGSGIGISIQVNRYKGVRGALCHDIETAKLSRQHNNSNILCLGARLHSIEKLVEMIEAWIGEEFEGGRHQDRVEQLDQ